MINENPFRAGDRVVFIGTKRKHLDHLRTGVPYRNGRGERHRSDPAHGRVIHTWRKNGRNMVDVDFGDYGNYCVYATELQFDVLDTLGAL